MMHTLCKYADETKKTVITIYQENYYYRGHQRIRLYT